METVKKELVVRVNFPLSNMELNEKSMHYTYNMESHIASQMAIAFPIKERIRNEKN